MIYDFHRNEVFVVFCRYYTTVLMIVTVIPVVLIAKRLCMKGTSKDLKKKVLTRHITYFVLYMIVLMTIYVDLYNLNDYFIKYLSDIGFNIVNFIFFEFIGVAIAYVRISEPIVY